MLPSGLLLLALRVSHKVTSDYIFVQPFRQPSFHASNGIGSKYGPAPAHIPIFPLVLIRLTPQAPRNSVGRYAPGVSSVIARV